jgi:hypothetical protein
MKKYVFKKYLNEEKFHQKEQSHLKQYVSKKYNIDNQNRLQKIQQALAYYKKMYINKTKFTTVI